MLGTVDQLIIDRCIMEEVKQYHRNLAVAFYDYRKAYDKVHHDWMLRVYQWIGIPREVVQLILVLMEKWKTRLEIWTNGKKTISRWIDIMCGFLQGDSYSPIGFCVSEIPVCKLLQQSKGYMMGAPGNRSISRTHSLFIDDLKQYQESHEIIKEVNEIIIQVNLDTRACYGVAKCAGIVFERGKMVKGEGLPVSEERMKAMDPDENEIYKFLGVEQADGIKTKNVVKRVKNEVKRRTKMLVETELNDANLIRAINEKLVPVAAYLMNVCQFNKGELMELDQVVKRELRSRNMLGRQGSDERLYLKREDGGRGLKSMRDVYKETRVRVTCYMAKSTNEWIRVAWKRETLKDENSTIDEAVATMAQLGADIQFENNAVKLGGKRIDGEWKPTWKKVKESFKKGMRSKIIENYKNKEQQSKLFAEQQQECNLWLSQNLDPRKTASILMIIEQMVETRAWKAARGLIEDGRCRICFSHGETVEHLVTGCRVLANSEYLTRHDSALMVLAVAWAKEYELIGEDTVWYKERW